MSRKVDGSYSRDLEAEREILLKDYLRYDWDEVTASETPKALKGIVSKKRSGEYLKAEFAEAVEKSRVG